MKRSNPAKGQEGMASIVVVSVLIVILTLISLGFARIISRSATNSANRQYSSSATYAALSGINDVAAYLKKYIQANGTNLLPRSTKCTGPGTLLGDSTHTSQPFYKYSDVSGNKTTKYTCMLLDPTPTSAQFTQVVNWKSQVVKVNTSATAGNTDKLMISWQASDPTVNGYPTSSSALNDETAWNNGSGTCKNAGVNAACTPILRATIYPISNGESLSNAQSTSKTVYLYPQSPAGNVPVYSYTDNTNFKDGSLIPVPCTQTVGVNTFTPSTNSDYKCNIIIGSLATAIAPASTDSIYLRLTPIYNQADIKIQANDKFGSSLNFVGVQAVVDITAQTGGVAKRLQGRVDTSSTASNSNGVDTNISSKTDSIPEQSLRTANALCKEVVQDVPSSGFAPYVGFEGPEGICHESSTICTSSCGPGGGNPVPSLTLNITGNNGQDNGRTVDSEANNPDVNVIDGSAQNPVQQGTVYVGSRDATGNISPGAMTITWHTQDASTCTATGGNGGDGWAGDKTPLTTFTGSPTKIGDGSQSFGGLTNRTEYDLVCNRAFAPGPSATKKVFVWPHPVVNISSSVNPPEAGQPYTITWSSTNTTRCVLSGDWPDPKKTGTADSENITWTQAETQQPNLSKIYMSECFDPIGRSDKKAITYNHVCPPGFVCVNGNPSFAPPTCTASVWFTGSSASDATIYWDTNCDYYDAANWWQGDRYLHRTFNGGVTWDGFASPGWMGKNTTGERLTSPGTYCAQVEAWADGWTTKADADGAGPGPNGNGAANSGNQCLVVGYPQVRVTSFVVDVWDNGPWECGSWAGALNNTWNCRNGLPIYIDIPDGNVPRMRNFGQGGGWGCADQDHEFGVCKWDDHFTAQLDDGSTAGITCQQSSSYGNYGPAITVPASGYVESGPWQWTGRAGPQPFNIRCTGPSPGPGGGPNVATRCYNGGFCGQTP